jgi:hypothetical protein
MGNRAALIPVLCPECSQLWFVGIGEQQVTKELPLEIGNDGFIAG